MANQKKKIAPVKKQLPTPNQTFITRYDDESLEAMRQLTQALLSVSKGMAKINKAETDEVKEPVKKDPPADPPVSSKVNLTQIRELINSKAGEGKTSAIVKTLGKYDAKNASSLAEENFDSFYNDLKKL